MTMKKSWIFVLIAFLVLLLLIIPKFISSEDDSNMAEAGPRSFKTPVEALIIKTESFDTKVVSSGTVLADEEVELRSEISGKISRIYFEEGTTVNKGDLLVKINDSELQAQLQKAGLRKKLAEDTEERARKRLEIEAVSQETYDNILNELNVIKSEIDLIKAQLEKTEIRAPFEGSIGLRYVSVGTFISSNTIIATLVKQKPVKIDFSVPEKYAHSVQAGDKFFFTSQGGDEKHEGKIYAIEPKIDPATRTLQMRGIFPNTNRVILPGAFVEVQLVLSSAEHAILIPTEALVPELTGQKVFLYEKGEAVPQKVETGQRTESRIQITSGVEAGDTLITTGILQMRPGAAVEIRTIN